MLSKTAEYALRAAVWLGRDPNQTQSADHLAERTQVPRRYLHKVLQDLVRAKIVRSQSGPGGGYALAGAPQKITILDVVNAVAPLERIRHCPLGLPSRKRLCWIIRSIAEATCSRIIRTGKSNPDIKASVSRRLKASRGVLA